MAKKKIIETHGKEESFEPTTLDEIMGYNPLSRYNTLEGSVYEEKLKEMNRTELEDEARRVGSFIVEDTVRLRENLYTEFNSYVTSLRRPKNVTRPISLSKEAEKILKEGANHRHFS